MRNVSPSLDLVLWVAIFFTAAATIVLIVGLTLLLGTTSHRKVALPLVWLGAAVLAAAASALVLLLVNR